MTEPVLRPTRLSWNLTGFWFLEVEVPSYLGNLASFTLRLSNPFDAPRRLLDAGCDVRRCPPARPDLHFVIADGPFHPECVFPIAHDWEALSRRVQRLVLAGTPLGLPPWPWKFWAPPSGVPSCGDVIFSLHEDGR